MTPIFSDSALLLEEDQEREEAIEELQAVISGHNLRQEATHCLESEKKKSSGGSLYWSLMSRTFLKKLWQSHNDEKDVSPDF